MEGAELKEGKERVMNALILPLCEKGMVRKRGCSAEAVSYTHLTLPTIYSV